MAILTSLEHIAFLSPTFPRAPGGGPRVFYEHANGLVNRGYRVSVMHSLNYRPGALRRPADMIKDRLRDARRGSLHPRVSWMNVDPRVEMLTLGNLYEHPPMEADIVVATYWQTAEHLAQFTTMSAVPIQLVQSYETWAGPTERVNAVWRLPFEMAVVSRDLAERGRTLGVPADRMHVVPNGLDHDLFRVTVPPAEREPRIGLLAHVSEVKGLPDAVSALKQVREIRPDVPVTAFAGGPRPEILPEWVEYIREPVGEQLVQEVYNRCTVFLCSSHAEGWGFPSSEAMACGAALASTRNGGVEDFAVHEESALLVPVREPEAMAKAVLRLLEDEDLRSRISAGGIESVGRLSWSASTDAFEAALAAAMRRAGRG